MSRYVRGDKKGFVLVTTLLVASITLIITIPYVARVAAEYKLMAKLCDATAALDLAEAAIDRAIWEFQHNGRAFTGWTHTISGSTNIYTVSAGSFAAQSGTVIGDYDARAEVAGDLKTMTAQGIGYVPSKSNPAATKTIRVTYINNNFNLAVGAAGDGGISLGKNSEVDSYDSSQGSYEDTHTQSGGNIATNGPITIPKNTDVYGDANPGADYPFSSQPNGVTGSWGTLQAPLVYEPIPDDALDGDFAAAHAAAASASGAETSNDNSAIVWSHNPPSSTLDGSGNLTVAAGETVTLPGGTEADPKRYYFRSVTVNGTLSASNAGGYAQIYVKGGNVSVGASKTMTVAGTSTLYISGGDLSLGMSSTVTASGNPTIYVERASAAGGSVRVGKQATLHVSGESTVYVKGGNLAVSTGSGESDGHLVITPPSTSGTAVICVHKTEVGTGGNLAVGGQGDITVNNSVAADAEAYVYLNYDRNNASLTAGGNFTIATQGDFNVNSPTTLYIAGGDIAIATQGDIATVPTDLMIYSTGDSIDLSTQADFYGAIYAPNADVTLSQATAGGELYGAIACNTFSSGTNTAVHYDKALLDMSPDWLNSRATSWREVREGN